MLFKKLFVFRRFFQFLVFIILKIQNEYLRLSLIFKRKIINIVEKSLKRFLVFKFSINFSY